MQDIDRQDDRGLAGRSVFITGAGSGIGAATARLLAKAGAGVALADTQGDAIEALAGALRDTGATVSCHVVDVTASDQVSAAVADAVAAHGKIDGAVNSAGILGASAALAEYPEDTFRKVLDINVMGVVNCMKAQLAAMLPGGKGGIVNIASAAGIIGWADHSAYVASKHAIVGLTKTTGLEYAKSGIRINSVCPAFIYTKLTDTMFETPGIHDAAVSLHPIGRLGEPEEVAEAVMWLLSGRSSFAVGSNLVLDGGSTVD